MEGKITASQFRALFQELTGDQSSTNKVCKSVQGFNLCTLTNVRFVEEDWVL